MLLCAWRYPNRLVRTGAGHSVARFRAEVRSPAISDGHAEVLGFFGRFMELSDGTFRIVVDDVLAKGDRVIVLVTESARRQRPRLVLAAGACVDRSRRTGEGLLAVSG